MFDGPRSLVHRITVRAASLSASDVAAEFETGLEHGWSTDSEGAEEGGGGKVLEALPPLLCPAAAVASGTGGTVGGGDFLPTSEAVTRYELGKSLLAAPSRSSVTPVAADSVDAAVASGGNETGENATTEEHPLSIRALEKSAKTQEEMAEAEVVIPSPSRDASKALEQFERADGGGDSGGYSLHPAAALAAAKLRLFGDRGSGGGGGVTAAPEFARPLFLRVFRSWHQVAASASAKRVPVSPSVVTVAAEAARWLGIMSASGIGGTQVDPSLAWNFYRLAAAGGDPVAMLALGYRHRHQGVENCMASAYYYRWAAEKTYSDVHTDHKTFFVDKTRLSVNWVRPDEGLEAGQRGEDDELIQYHMMQAQQGDVEAMTNLGDLYYYGARGMPMDHAASFEQYSRAAAVGNSNALSRIASMHMKGEGTAENHTAAREAFEQSAAIDDNPKGHNGLAYLYYYGKGVEQNYTTALRSFEAAARAGNTDASFNAGLMHKEGRGTVVNMTAAEHFFVKAAGSGHFDAIFMLGGLFLMGETDDNVIQCSKGQHYYKMAGEYGEWAGQIRSGFDAFLAEDPAAAARHYETASELGYEVAMHNAAWLYDNGYVEPTPATPLLALGTTDAGESDPKTQYQASPDEPELDFVLPTVRAQRLLKMALTEGSASAALKLGDYAFYGHGQSRSDDDSATACQVDHVAARKYYTIAAGAGVAQAAYSLGYMYHSGGHIWSCTNQAIKFDWKLPYDLIIQHALLVDHGCFAPGTSTAQAVIPMSLARPMRVLPMPQRRRAPTRPWRSTITGKPSRLWRHRRQPRVTSLVVREKAPGCFSLVR